MRLSGIIAAMLLLALAAAGQSRVELAAGSAQVGRLAKIEFTIRVDGKYENPFDQDEVEIGVELTSRSGKRIVQPAFFPYSFSAFSFSIENATSAAQLEHAPSALMLYSGHVSNPSR